MPPDPAVIAEAQRWLRFAADDLASAQLHLATSMILPNQACYHAQQAAEKAIKAQLILRGCYFPKSHDLSALATLLPAADQALVKDLDLVSLTAWVVAGRYPTDLGEANATSAQAAIATARQLFDRIHQQSGLSLPERSL